VIVAYVPESDNKPHYYTGRATERQRQWKRARQMEAAHAEDGTRVYIRVNDKTVMASREVVKILRDERPDAPPLRFEMGENEKRLFRYLDQNERITTREFSRLVNISERRAMRILVSLVRAGVMRIHTLEKCDFFTMAYDVSRA